MGATLPDTQAQGTQAPSKAYLETLLAYYEEEIEGEAWYHALADIVEPGPRADKMRMLAEVERHCAAIVQPLIDRYGLTPRPTAELQAAGRAYASEGPQDWDGLITYMHDSFPAYMPAFEALEAMAPEADRPLLARMTEHEAVAIAFLKAELAGESHTTEPLERYLASPVQTKAAA